MTLPAPNEPLILADGTRIDAKTRAPANSVEIPRHTDLQAHVVRTRRKLDDLPDVPRRMNVLSIIVTYTLFGLTNAEIATALELEEPRIAALKSLAPFKEMLTEVTKSAIKRDGDEVRNLLQQESLNAVNRVTHLMNNAETESVQLSAARDILDRSNNRPDDVKHTHGGLSATLCIEHVVRSEDTSIPALVDVIDGEFVDD